MTAPAQVVAHTTEYPCPACQEWVREQLKRAPEVSVETRSKLKALLVPPAVAG